jgi:lysine biosynthesis protein LysW
MPKTYCPGCDAIIALDNPQTGAMVTCHKCDEELEIISIDPFEVDFPLDYYDSDDVWDDEEEDE